MTMGADELEKLETDVTEVSCENALGKGISISFVDSLTDGYSPARRTAAPVRRITASMRRRRGR